MSNHTSKTDASSSAQEPANQTLTAAFRPAQARLALSVPEAAKMTGFGQTTIYAEIKTGTLRARKLGARTFITMDDLRAWLDGKPVIGGEP